MKKQSIEEKFYTKLAYGRLGEEVLAKLLEEQGFDVERIGSYRLPVDLYIHKKGTPVCWIQVKTSSTNTLPKIKPEDIAWWVLCEKETGVPVQLFVLKLKTIKWDWKTIKVKELDCSGIKFFDLFVR